MSILKRRSYRRREITRPENGVGAMAAALIGQAVADYRDLFHKGLVKSGKPVRTDETSAHWAWVQRRSARQEHARNGGCRSAAGVETLVSFFDQNCEPYATLCGLDVPGRDLMTWVEEGKL